MPEKNQKKTKQKHIKKSSGQRKIALERIMALFEQARQRFDEDRGISKRYLTLARKISMKYKISIPSELKRRFCKSCGYYLKPSVNCRVRLQKNKKVAYYCLECKNFNRVGYGK